MGDAFVISYLHFRTADKEASKEQQVTETEIQDLLISYFHSEGYKPWRPESEWHSGPDIVAYHPDRHHLWIIEAKGDIANFSDRLDAFKMALGQICLRSAEEWKQKTGSGSPIPADIVTYGLAFPEGKDSGPKGRDYRNLCRQIRPGVRSALSLYLFFLQPDVSIPTIIDPHIERF